MQGISVVSVVDALATELRDRLLQGDLEPGTPVTELSLVERYGVSRPSAKAAIEQVVGEGLLVRTAHRSARVPELGAADARDIYRARIALELAPVRGLAGQRQVPAEAREANEAIRALGESDRLAVVTPDMRFHMSLVEAYGSPRLIRAYEALAAEVRLCMVQVQGRSLLTTAGIAAEHEQLLQAIERGDGDEAERILTEHLHGAADRLAAALGE